MFSFDVSFKSKMGIFKGKLLECSRVFHDWIQECGYLNWFFGVAKTSKVADAIILNVVRYCCKQVWRALSY